MTKTQTTKAKLDEALDGVVWWGIQTGTPESEAFVRGYGAAVAVAVKLLDEADA